MHSILLDVSPKFLIFPFYPSSAIASSPTNLMAITPSSTQHHLNHPPPPPYRTKPPPTIAMRIIVIHTNLHTTPNSPLCRSTPKYHNTFVLRITQSEIMISKFYLCFHFTMAHSLTPMPSCLPFVSYITITPPLVAMGGVNHYQGA